MWDDVRGDVRWCERWSKNIRENVWPVISVNCSAGVTELTWRLTQTLGRASFYPCRIAFWNDSHPKLRISPFKLRRKVISGSTVALYLVDYVQIAFVHIWAILANIVKISFTFRSLIFFYGQRINEFRWDWLCEVFFFFSNWRKNTVLSSKINERLLRRTDCTEFGEIKLVLLKFTRLA